MGTRLWSCNRVRPGLARDPWSRGEDRKTPGMGRRRAGRTHTPLRPALVGMAGQGHLGCPGPRAIRHTPRPRKSQCAKEGVTTGLSVAKTRQSGHGSCSGWGEWEGFKGPPPRAGMGCVLPWAWHTIIAVTPRGACSHRLLHE